MHASAEEERKMHVVPVSGRAFPFRRPLPKAAEEEGKRLSRLYLQLQFLKMPYILHILLYGTV